MMTNDILLVGGTKEKRMKTIKNVVRFVVDGLVGIFAGAVNNCVVDRVEGSKMAKIGAKAGGFLVGAWVGDQVSNYICDTIDEFADRIDEIKESLEEE